MTITTTTTTTTTTITTAAFTAIHYRDQVSHAAWLDPPLEDLYALSRSARCPPTTRYSDAGKKLLLAPFRTGPCYLLPRARPCRIQAGMSGLPRKRAYCLRNPGSPGAVQPCAAYWLLLPQTSFSAGIISPKRAGLDR